jgi:hypothetical protein
MPTILELFQNQPLPSQGGQTAEAAYAIRDSKDIDINVADPLVNSTGILLAKGARKVAGIKGSETLLEQELTGVRIIRSGAIPVIYGTELPRITLRTTSTLESMRASTVGELADNGSLGGKILNAADSVKSALGLGTPITPTYTVGQLVGNSDINLKETQDRMLDLQTIKSSATGLPASKFLGELGGLLQGGNLKTVARGLIGAGLRAGKDKLREKLFGTGERGARKELPPSYEDGTPIGPNSLTTFVEGSTKWLSPSIRYGSDSQIQPSREPQEGVIDKNGSTYSNLLNINPSAEPGERFDLSEKQIISLGYDPNDNETKLSSLFSNKFAFKQPNFTAGQIDVNNVVDAEGNLVNTGGGLSNAQIFVGDGELDNEVDSLIIQETQERANDKIELSIDRQRFSAEPNRAPKFSQKITRRDYNTDEFIENKYFFNSVGDSVNATGVYSGDDEFLDNSDFITLKFKSIPLNKSVNFRSTISGLTETFSPSWEPSNFIGNPFSFYTYNSIERSVSFNFDAFSLNAEEHKTMWDKLNFLQGLTYPQGYYPTSAVKPPLIELTLGSMYKKKVAFIESLSFTTEDNVPWNIADSVDYVVNVTPTGERQIAATPQNMQDYKLPMIVSVAVGLKFLESRNTTEGRKFYSFTPQTS